MSGHYVMVAVQVGQANEAFNTGVDVFVRGDYSQTEAAILALSEATVPLAKVLNISTERLLELQLDRVQELRNILKGSA